MNETLTPKDPKLLDIGLVFGGNFIWSLVQDLVEVKPVGCMTSGVDGFRPKVVGTLELRHHCSCRINQHAILPFLNTILLRGICSGILMFDPLITRKFIQGVVLELGAIVTPYSQNLQVVLTLSLNGKLDDSLLGLTFLLEEIDP